MYHPDKQQHQQQAHHIKEFTLKFQAVSAAYQVLMDAGRRSAYDATGGVVDEYGGDGGDDYRHSASRSRERNRGTNNSSSSDNEQQQRWDDFFNSVFCELLSATNRHADKESYRGSAQETNDVLKFYTTCKGDLKKVQRCVLHGVEEDLDRWKKDIIAPAIERGDAQDYGNGDNDVAIAIAVSDQDGIADNNKSLFSKQKGKQSQKRYASRSLMDSSDGDDGFDADRRTSKISSFSKKKTLRKSIGQVKKTTPTTARTATNNALCDTDDDDDKKGTNATHSTSATIAPLSRSISMNKRDKMEYRVAKKRKLKAMREMEVADIIKSKTWSGSSSSSARAGVQNPTRQRSGMFTDELLSGMEKKYSANSSENIGRGGIRNKRGKKKKK